MPNCFQLTKKGDNEPSTLNSIDEAICIHLGVEVHPQVYCAGWYDYIGFALAMGKDWAQIRQRLADTVREFPDEGTTEWAAVMGKILQFLEDNYTADAWATVGR